MTIAGAAKQITRHSSFRTLDDPDPPGASGSLVKRFKLIRRTAGEPQEIVEQYEQKTDDPEKWCRDLVDWFNRTLRPHEQPREFVRCELLGEVPPKDHRWFKKTVMTNFNRFGAAYDLMQCERCGVTGKRFGLAASIKIDSKFRGKQFSRCDTALPAMQKRREKDVD